MSKQNVVPEVHEWQVVLWVLFVASLILGLMLIGLGYWVRSIFLVGAMYGLFLVGMAFLTAHHSVRIEYGIPFGKIKKLTGFSILFRGLQYHPQCISILGLGLATIAFSAKGFFRETDPTNKDIPENPSPLFVENHPQTTNPRPNRKVKANKTSPKEIDVPNREIEEDIIPPKPIVFPKRKTEENLNPPKIVEVPKVVPEDPPVKEDVTYVRWSFDEGTGAKTWDSGKHKLQAVLHGCKWVPGVKGKALAFDGQADYLELSSSEVLDFEDGAPFTIALWVKTTKAQGHLFSFRHKPDTMDLVSIFVRGRKLVVWVRQQGEVFDPDPTSSNTLITDGHWHHIAFTRDSVGQVTLFLDGKANAILNKIDRSRGKLQTNLRALGREALHERDYFEGAIDELQIVGDFLSEKAIRKLAGKE